MGQTAEETLISLGLDSQPAIEGLNKFVESVVAAHGKVTASAAASATAQVSANAKVQQSQQSVFDAKKKLDDQQTANATKLAEEFIQRNKVTLDETEKDYVTSIERRYVAAKAIEDAGAKSTYEVWKKAAVERERLEDQLDKARETYVAREEARQHHLAATTLAVANQATRSGLRALLQDTGIPTPALAGGAALAAGVVSATVITQIKEAVQGYLQLGDATHQLMIETGGSANAMSTMIAVAQKYGVTSNDLFLIMNRLKAMIVSAPQDFERLGIATKNTDGSLRSVADVFVDLRNKIANAKQDANTMQTATDLLGRSAYELLPYLTASSSEIDAMGQSVQGTALVMDEKGVEAAKRYQQEMRNLGAVMQSVKDAAGEKAMGFVDTMHEGAIALDNDIRKIMNALQLGINPMLPGAANSDPGSRRGEPGDPSTVKKTAPGGPELLNPQLAAQEHAKRMKDIQDESAFEQETTTKANDKLQERIRLNDRYVQEELKGINDAWTLRSRAHEDQMRQLNDTYQAEQKARSDAVTALNEALQKRNEAGQDELDIISKLDEATTEFNRKRTEAQREQVKALQDQVTALDKAYQLQQQTQALEDAQTNLRHAQSVQIYRTKSETEEQYQEKVYANSLKIKDAEKRFADETKKVALDKQKTVLQDQIKAIETQMEVERKAAESYAEGERKRAEGIRDRMKADAKATAEKVKAIEEVSKKEATKHDALLKQLDAEWLKESRTHEDTIKHIEDESVAFKQNIQEQIELNNSVLKAEQEDAKNRLEAEQKAYNGFAEASTKAANTAVADMDRVRQAAHEANAEILRLQNAGSGNATGPLGSNGVGGRQTGGDQTGDSPSRSRTQALARQLLEDAQAAFGLTQGQSAFSEFARPILGFAGGGSLQVSEPHYVVNARTGRAVAAVAERATETLRVTPAGGGHNGPLVIQLVADGRVLAQTVVPHLGAGMGAGYRGR